MIHDVDETLKALIRRDVVNGSGVEISFEAPTREWAAKRTVPTVNVYLYDIREDLSRRDVFYEEIRDDAGMVVDRRQPPRRFKLSYLLTAWTQRPEDEHRLLSALLGTFLKDDILPDDLLVGSLVEVGKPVITQVALPPTEDRSISDVWSALGGELKPSLDLAIVAPFDPKRSMPAGPPVVEEPRIGFAAPGADTEDIAGGRGKGKPKPKVAAGARSIGGKGGSEPDAAPRAPSAVEVELDALEIPTHSPEGKPLTLPMRMQLARKERDRRRVAEAAALSAQEETLQSGDPEQPGRIFRVRGVPRS